MKSSLIFDYLAIINISIVLIALFIRRLNRGIENYFFMTVVLSSLATTLFDIGMEATYRTLPMSSTRLVVDYIFSYGYFLSRQICNIAFIFLIFAITDTWYKLQDRRCRALFTVPFVLICIYIMSNIVTHRIFYITPEEGYIRGPSIIVLYIYSFAYITFGFIYLCRMKSYLGTGKWVAMISMYVFLLGTAVFQYINNGYLVEMYASSVALLLILLIVMRPEEMFDPDMGVYGITYFRQHLDRIMMSEREATVLFVKVLNVGEIRNYFGEDRYKRYISMKIVAMENALRKKHKDYNIFYNPAGSVMVVFGRGSVDIRSEYPEIVDCWKDDVNSYSGRVITAAAGIDFPKHFKDREEIFQFALIFDKFLKVGETYVNADSIVHDPRYIIYSNISHILEGAVVENRFEMYYQPIYDVKNKCFNSAEALIRLNDPEFGFISPAIFIPEAEKRNLILPIGSFVMEEVFRFVAGEEFEKLGLDYIEVNLSVEQVVDRNIVHMVEELLNKYHTRPERINMEITESAAGLFDRIDRNNLQKMVEKGFTFSLDDFGTGYSNIKRAIGLPLSIVKIDKSVIDIVDTSKGESMVRNIIRMMHDAGFKIVAEGVETYEIFKILEGLDCDYIQGYYFSKPVPKADFVKFIEEHNK